MSAPTESFTESLMKDMYEYERQAVNEYLGRICGVEDCFDCMDSLPPASGVDNPRFADVVDAIRSYRDIWTTWREAWGDLKTAFWGGDRPLSAEFDMFVTFEGEKCDSAAWYLAQQALAELTGKPVIRSREG